MLNRLSRLAVPVVAATLLLSACGGGSSDSKDKLAAAAPAPSSSPVPTVSPMPDAATKHTDDGAVAFVKYWFGTVLNDSYRLGDVKRLVELSDPNCVVCRSTVGDIAFFAVQGQRSQGGELSVGTAKVAESNSEVTSIDVTYSAAKLSEINPDGSTAYSVPAHSGVEVIAQVQWVADGNGWRMAQIVDKKLVGKSS